jgi:hypothetical protein
VTLHPTSTSPGVRFSTTLGVVLHVDELVEALGQRPLLPLLLFVAEVVVPGLGALLGPETLLLAGLPHSLGKLLHLREESVVVLPKETIDHP